MDEAFGIVNELIDVSKGVLEVDKECSQVNLEIRLKLVRRPFYFIKVSTVA